MKSVSLRAFVLVVVAGFMLAGCGKTPSESERSYAGACVRILKGSEAAYGKRCECEAGIVVPKLTPGELKAYLASPDWPKGALNPEAVAKFTSEHGFTMDENSSLGVKLQESFPEISKTCDKAR
jgi:hypothetical protein